LNNKLTEVRSTIKFQLKKVLCLGVAVGHVQMSDDQVLANVMLSTRRVLNLFSIIYTRHARHQLLGFAAQEKLAKCQVVAHQVDDGQTYPRLLNAHSTVCSFDTGGEQGVEGPSERRESNKQAAMQNKKPRTLGPTAFWGLGADWELMRSAC
jgi:hypothetical protein